jgi:aryl-alcohol dehydrogenase-like predicted oxidoreductase
LSSKLSRIFTQNKIALNPSKLALGTVQFGLAYGISNETGKTSSSEVQAILSEAAKLGIGMLDTASNYGDSETVIGNSFSRDFSIVSKFPGELDSSCELRASLKGSLEKN